MFWDWKSGKIVKRLRAHKEVVIDHVWLPNEHVSCIPRVGGDMCSVLMCILVQDDHCLLGWADQVVDVGDGCAVSDRDHASRCSSTVAAAAAVLY